MSSFVWADLSTYSPETSKRFYERVFGWEFHDAGGYQVALKGSAEIAGLFETPDFFKQIKMPHFWMSYIAVEEVLPIVDMIGSFEGAKVELTDDFYGGKVALIRDPQGAGFTIYDGGKLDSRKMKAGHMVWNELHVSDASRVIPFYERLFGWTVVESESKDKFSILSPQREHLSDILVIPNEVKGKYEYWVCTFAVDDLGLARRRIEDNGGGVVMDEGERLMMHDDSGEAFFYIQCIE